VVQTGIGIGLQGALEVFKVTARMFSLAIL
jgi:hypothetical protein